jgi:5-methylcytosine-specific restriction endonuclease McrA
MYNGTEIPEVSCQVFVLVITVLVNYNVFMNIEYYKINLDIYKHDEPNMYYLLDGEWQKCGSQGTYTQSAVDGIVHRRKLTKEEMEYLMLELL